MINIINLNFVATSLNFPGQWINNQIISEKRGRKAAGEAAEVGVCGWEWVISAADDSCYCTSALPGGHLLLLTYTEPKKRTSFCLITSCFMGN